MLVGRVAGVPSLPCHLMLIDVYMVPADRDPKATSSILLIALSPSSRAGKAEVASATSGEV